MSALERRLHEALSESAGLVTPAPDLFARVQESVANDLRVRRRRRLLRCGGAVAALAGVAVLWWGTTRAASLTRAGRGGGDVSWWVLELATTLGLVALALWLGPFIKRFGRAYAADVFHDNPLTGKSYIVLTDIVYYLIFTAYIMFTVRFELPGDWPATVSAPQLKESFARVAGILLIIGVLHGLNIVLLPVLGRLFSLNRRLAPATTLAPSQRERIDEPG